MNTACTQIALVPISPARRWLALLSGMLTAMLYFTTIMVVTSIMPQIQGAMAATADEVSWVVTFNLLATAIATPMTGWLVTRFGRKRTMCACIAGFGISTLDVWVVAVARGTDFLAHPARGIRCPDAAA